MSELRAVCLNCIDGRFQIPVIHWIKENLKAEYVDMITEPGMDGFLADKNNSIEDTHRKIQISIDKNNAKTIVIVGHGDCKGNPGSASDHKQHIQTAVVRLKEKFSDKAVKGLWIDEDFEGILIE